jgi:hypothetical protein
MKYKVNVPPTMEQGSYKCIAEASYSETMRQNALWQYNKAREHDGLPPVKRLPNGTTFDPVKVLFSV